jgi:hypothetical protein
MGWALLRWRIVVEPNVEWKRWYTCRVRHHSNRARGVAALRGAACLLLLGFLCAALLKWPVRYSHSDIFLGIDLIVMAMLGGIATAHAPETNVGKFLFVSSFLVLGVVGVKLVIQQSNDTANAEQKLTDTLTGIAEEVTGGDSFCYVDIRQWGGLKDAVRAILLQKGRYPLTNVDVSIVQVDDFIHHLGSLNEITRDFTFSFVRRGSFVRILTDYQVGPDEQSRAFNVTVVARNGRFSELVRLHRINGVWTTAKLVDASYYGGVTGVVLEEIDKGFPIDTLASDNDWTNIHKLKRLTIKETE